MTSTASGLRLGAEADEARATADAEQRDRLQQRVLDYNEDDTAATAWIRDHTADLVSLTELEGA